MKTLLALLLALQCSGQQATVLSYYSGDTSRPAMQAWFIDSTTVVLQAILSGPADYSDSTVTLLLDSGYSVQLRMKERLYSGCHNCCTASFTIPRDAIPILKAHNLRVIQLTIAGQKMDCCRHLQAFTFFKDNL